MTQAQEKCQSMGIDLEMTQILESADMYFKVSILTMLNLKKYAYDEWRNITNFIWEINYKNVTNENSRSENYIPKMKLQAG